MDLIFVNYCHIHRRMPLRFIPRLINSVYNLRHYFLQVNFNIIFPSTLLSSNLTSSHQCAIRIILLDVFGSWAAHITSLEPYREISVPCTVCTAMSVNFIKCLWLSSCEREGWRASWHCFGFGDTQINLVTFETNWSVPSFWDTQIILFTFETRWSVPSFWDTQISLFTFETLIRPVNLRHTDQSCHCWDTLISPVTFETRWSVPTFWDTQIILVTFETRWSVPSFWYTQISLFTIETLIRPIILRHTDQSCHCWDTLISPVTFEKQRED